MYHINDIEKYRDFSLKSSCEEDLSDLEDGEFNTMKSSDFKVYEKMHVLLGTMLRFCSQEQ